MSDTAENDAAVTSVEPGCTCGGVAACPQCQDRDACVIPPATTAPPAAPPAT